MVKKILKNVDFGSNTLVEGQIPIGFFFFFEVHDLNALYCFETETDARTVNYVRFYVKGKRNKTHTATCTRVVYP